MWSGPVANRRKVKLARIRLGIGNKLGNRSGRNCWIDHHDKWPTHNGCDWGDVADEIEIELVVQRRVDRVEAPNHEQRVAVRRGLHDSLGADIAAGAWPALRDEWLTKAFGQPLAQ